MNKKTTALIEEILEKSKGHWVVYEYGDENGSLKPDQAIPIGWLKEWLNVALIKLASHHQAEIAKLKKEQAERVKELNGFKTLDLDCDEERAANLVEGYQQAKDDVLKALKSPQAGEPVQKTGRNEEINLVGGWTLSKCPKCGSRVLGNKNGDKWCSLVGCDYSETKREGK